MTAKDTNQITKDLVKAGFTKKQAEVLATKLKVKKMVDPEEDSKTELKMEKLDHLLNRSSYEIGEIERARDNIEKYIRRIKAIYTIPFSFLLAVLVVLLIYYIRK